MAPALIGLVGVLLGILFAWIHKRLSASEAKVSDHEPRIAALETLANYIWERRSSELQGRKPQK